MNKTFFSFIFSLSLLTLFVYLACAVFFHYFPDKQPAAINYLYVFFYIITVVVHLIIMKAAGKRPQQFPAYFMGTTAIKLFSSFMFIVPYAYLNKSEVTRFLLTFFMFYIIFTVFEIVSILGYLKSQNSGLKQ